MKKRWDVLVVGAGPAGSTAAALLADAGHSVLVVEKEEFPRFRIGESLLPACVPVIERLGIEPTEDTFVYKRGAEFICEDTDQVEGFAFDSALPGCPTHAWHVERSLFDMRLRDRARAGGAEVRHGEAVTNAGVSGDHAWIEVGDGKSREEARFLLDASGQNRLLARRMNSVQHYDTFGMSAVFTHFEGVADAAMEELGPGFDVRIMLRTEGWGWIIPLPGNRISVGMVGRDKMTPGVLNEGLLAGPMVTRLSAGARRLDTHIVGNFSYKNTTPIGARFAAIGDAACFLDPVFSSGVALALHAAEEVADALSPALHANAEAAPDLLDAHRASMDRAYLTFSKLIHRFYNSNFASSFFLQKGLGDELRQGVMSVLAGDVWRTDNRFQEMLLNSRQGEGAGSEPALV